MKKYSFIAVSITLSFIIQTSLFNFINIIGTLPNLSLVLVVIFSMMTNGIIGGLIGLFTGILFDSMMYDVFGIYTLVYFVIGVSIGTYADDMQRDNFAAYTVIAALSTIVFHFLLYIILFFLKFRLDMAAGFLVSILIEAAINAVLVIIVLKLILKIFEVLNLK